MSWEQDLGCGLAILFAISAIYLDCYQALRKTRWKVPRQFWSSFGLAALSLFCGALAGAAFAYASLNAASGWLDTLLGSKVENVYLRGIYTGLAVLAIIRSKITEVKNADVGFEFIYSECRLRCLSNIRVSWTIWRQAFVSRNVAKSFSIANFDTDMLDLVQEAVKDADAQYVASVLNQIGDLKKQKPSSTPTDQDRPWVVYNTSIINLVLENCGPKPLTALGFA